MEEKGGVKGLREFLKQPRDDEMQFRSHAKRFSVCLRGGSKRKGYPSIKLALFFFMYFSSVLMPVMFVGTRTAFGMPNL